LLEHHSPSQNTDKQFSVFCFKNFLAFLRAEKHRTDSDSPEIVISQPHHRENRSALLTSAMIIKLKREVLLVHSIPFLFVLFVLFVCELPYKL
jgi:hypothetical protein